MRRPALSILTPGLALALASALAFASVGAALPAHADSTDVRPWLPIEAGRVWRYEVSKERRMQMGTRAATERITGTSRQRVVGRSEAVRNGAPVFVVEQEVAETNVTKGRTLRSTVETHVSVAPGEVLMHAQRIEGHPTLPATLARFEPAPALLKLPLPADGEPWPSRLASHGLVLDVRPYARAVEAVTTPLGRFADCLRIDARGTASGTMPGPAPLPITDGHVDETLWFAKDVGLVKQLRVTEMSIRGPGGRTIRTRETTTRELVGYEK